MKPAALVIHVPHAATMIPAGLRDQFVLDDDELAREVLLMTDHYVDELFALPAEDAATVRHEVSRLVLEPERFRTGDPMEQVGMGPVYTRTHDGRPLRCELTAPERAALFELYDGHHARLTQAVRAAVEANGRCLIVDAHSFPSQPLPYEKKSAAAGDPRWKHRPAICLGSDTPGSLPAGRSHTPAWLRAAAYDAFAARFESVAFDRPFAGSIVPLEFLGRDARVATIMVEVRRDQYMDEASGEKLAGFEQVASDLRAAVRELAAAARRRPD